VAAADASPAWQVAAAGLLEMLLLLLPGQDQYTLPLLLDQLLLLLLQVLLKSGWPC
jgi:hypothetical protein